MKTYTREFLSQYYGRVIGNVDGSYDRDGLVTISFESVPESMSTYRFSAGELKPRAGMTVEEVALRAAIAKLHRHARAGHSASDSTLLSSAPLWVGDFIDSPFREAHVEFVRRGISQQERRTSSAELENSIGEAVRLRETAGPRAAREFLAKALVSRAVIRRVMVHRQMRRDDLELIKPVTSKETH